MKNKKTAIFLRLNEDLKKAIKKKALQNKRTLTAQVIHLLSKAMKGSKS